MNKLRNIISIITAGLHRFHMVIFIVTVVAGLAAAILLLNEIVLKASSSANITQTSPKSSFDQATIDRIKQLKTSNEPGEPLDFSKGRISPFSE